MGSRSWFGEGEQARGSSGGDGVERPLAELSLSLRYLLGMVVSSRYSLGIWAGSAHRLSLSFTCGDGIVFDGVVVIVGERVVVVVVGGVVVVVGGEIVIVDGVVIVVACSIVHIRCLCYTCYFIVHV